MSTKTEMSPVQSKEHLDEILELQVEEGELARKLAACAEKHKEAKAAHDLKQSEIMKKLEALNQDLPLFDKTEDIPWPFPVPTECREATLANVAADPTVLSLTIGIVKNVREVLGVSSLGELELKIGGREPVAPTKLDKAKKDLAKLIGTSQALKLLRGVASYTGGRMKTSGKKGKEKPPGLEGPKEEKPTKPAGDPANWRDTLCADVEELTPNEAKVLAQLELKTIGQALDKLAVFMKEAPENPPKDYLAKRLASHLQITAKPAADIVKHIYEFEEKHVTKEAA